LTEELAKGKEIEEKKLIKRLFGIMKKN